MMRKSYVQTSSFFLVCLAHAFSTSRPAFKLTRTTSMAKCGEPWPYQRCLRLNATEDSDTMYLLGRQGVTMRNNHDSLTRQVENLQREIKQTQNLVDDIAGALLYADDLGLMEREQKMAIFNRNLTGKRTPTLFRPTLASILMSYQRVPRPIAHNWHVVSVNTTLL